MEDGTRKDIVAKPETVNRVCEIVKTQLALPDGSVAAPDKFLALGADSIDTGYTNIESEIDASNRARLEKMSPEEIAHTQAEIMKNMDPALKKILQEKEQDKTRKNSFISPNSSISSTSLLTCTPFVEKARRRLRLYEEKSVSNFKKEVANNPNCGQPQQLQADNEQMCTLQKDSVGRFDQNNIRATSQATGVPRYFEGWGEHIMAYLATPINVPVHLLIMGKMGTRLSCERKIQIESALLKSIENDPDIIIFKHRLLSTY
ncbi:transcriptional elongation regulator MINIYO [Tanacetum coccineum]